MPPEILGYRHAAVEYYYDGSSHKAAHVCDGTGEDQRCSDRFGLAYLAVVNLIRGVMDHTDYINPIPIIIDSAGWFG